MTDDVDPVEFEAARAGLRAAIALASDGAKNFSLQQRRALEADLKKGLKRLDATRLEAARIEAEEAWSQIISKEVETAARLHDAIEEEKILRAHRLQASADSDKVKRRKTARDLLLGEGHDEHPFGAFTNGKTPRA